MIIYKITNRINGKVYVGQTRQRLSIRCRQHKSKKSNCSLLGKALAKHGVASFSVEILRNAKDQVELDWLEQAYIAYYGTMGAGGYNLTTGGEGGYTRSEDTRRLLSEAGVGKTHSRHTSESIAKIVAAQKGSNGFW